MGARKKSQTPAIGRVSNRPMRIVLVAATFAVSSAAVPVWSLAAGPLVPPTSTVATVAPAPAVTAVAATAGNPVPAEALQLIDLSPDQIDLVNHAVGLFAESGLVLPPLVVQGHMDKAACGGHDGMHRLHAGWSEIDLCGGKPQHSAVVHTVLHEIAHAWAAAALTDERRAAFQALRGFEFWRNYQQAAWEDNGTEQAAEIIAWGVNDRSASTVRIDRVSCGELHAGYVALTGLEPRYGLTTICAGVKVGRS